MPMGVAAPDAGALSSSPFCKSLLVWAQHPVAPPSSMTIKSYRAYALAALPLYQKMEATAPNAKVKQILMFIDTALKAYANTTSLAKLAAYQKANHTQFVKDTGALVAAIKSCI